MFDNTKLNVDMSGKDYISYLKYRRETSPFRIKTNFTKKQKVGIVILIASLLLAAFVFVMVDSFFVEHKSTDVFTSYRLTAVYGGMSWNVIAKSAALYFGPVLVVAVALGWVFHGVGFFIVKR